MAYTPPTIRIPSPGPERDPFDQPAWAQRVADALGVKEAKTLAADGFSIKVERGEWVLIEAVVRKRVRLSDAADLIARLAER